MFSLFFLILNKNEKRFSLVSQLSRDQILHTMHSTAHYCCHFDAKNVLGHEKVATYWKGQITELIIIFIVLLWKLIFDVQVSLKLICPNELYSRLQLSRGVGNPPVGFWTVVTSLRLGWKSRWKLHRRRLTIMDRPLWIIQFKKLHLCIHLWSVHAWYHFVSDLGVGLFTFILGVIDIGNGSWKREI